MLFSALFRKNIKSYSDVELIAQLKKNDQYVMGEFFRRYAILVMGLCLKYLKNQNLAEDMMMEIFERLPEKIKKHEIQNFKSWLFSVSRNECLMELRKKKHDVADFEKELIYQRDSSEESLNQYLKKETELVLLERAIEELKEDQKMALTYFYLQEKSYGEVAQLMQTTLNAVKSLIQNGKRNLKLKMES